MTRRTYTPEQKAEAIARVLAGEEVSRVAREMNISVKTVDNYRARMTKKTGLKTRAEIMRFAASLGSETSVE